jgi:hypothetical protein
MFGLVRAGGLAAALATLASFATPSAAQAPTQIAQLAPTSVTISSVALPTVSSVSFSRPASAVNAAQAKFAGFMPSAAAGFVAPPAGVALPVASGEQQHRPLHDLVISFVNFGNQNAEQMCLVKAVYFEARSETLEGQLAVAEVILNRTTSGLYPTTICEVVTQPAQFSFIRNGRFPTADTNSDGWRKALAIADIALKGLAQNVGRNVLWYHASYVAPSWGRRLTRVARIGTHIFYS